MLSLLGRAGATVTAQIQLTNDFTDPARADELRSLAATTLPTGATLPEVPQAGAIAGGAARLGADRRPAGGNAAASPEQAAAVLSALTSAGFITVTGTPAAGQSVVILTGAEVTGGSEADRAADRRRSGRSAGADRRRGGGRRPAGLRDGRPARSASSAATPRSARRSPPSTTSTPRPAGWPPCSAWSSRTAAASGRYGFADNAQAQVPTLAVG